LVKAQPGEVGRSVLKATEGSVLESRPTYAGPV
jgi:hypothetical protein